MRTFRIPKLLFGSSLLSSILTASVSADVIVVPWNHVWNFMHPLNGALPGGSGNLEPNAGPTGWYARQAEFAASYSGPSFSSNGPDYRGGAGAGPLGYGSMDYFTSAGAEFTVMGTSLPQPPSGSRFTDYFRTAFTVAPNSVLTNPVLRYILDDGGFVYLDGELILRVNMVPGAPDYYRETAVNTTGTESFVRSASLNLPLDSVTGGNATAGLAVNAVIVKRVYTLQPGTHTLAVSVHNQSGFSSTDLGLAVQLRATQSSCAIDPTVRNVIRTDNGTPSNPNDDKMQFVMNVTPLGAVGATGWAITAPPSLTDSGGPYGHDVPVTDISIGEFPSGFLNFIVADIESPNCQETVSIPLQHIIATDDHAGLNTPVFSAQTIPLSGWVFNDTARTMTMTSGGGGAGKVVKSQVVDLTNMPGARFSGVLQVDDTGNGNESADRFAMYAIMDGNLAAPVNLFGLVLSDTILAPGPGTFYHSFSRVFPITAHSAQIVIEGINDAATESFTVRDLKFTTGPPVLIVTPASNIVRHENGAGPADDTVTFDTTVTGFNAGAGWTSAENISPVSRAYGAVNITILPVIQDSHSIAFRDAAFPGVTASITVPVPRRYLLGYRNWGNGPLSFGTELNVPPPLQYVNPFPGIIDLENAGANEVVLESETLDLRQVGNVTFDAELRAYEIGADTGYEANDRFKVELIYQSGGVNTTINLITRWDIGDGSSAITGSGANGPPDGYLNGYTGAAGTNVFTGQTYASKVQDYDDNRSRDEFNIDGWAASDVFGSVFMLSARVPANADSVKLKLYTSGIGGSSRPEFYRFSNVGFAGSGPVDTDGDGMDNDWEISHGLNPNSPADRLSDLDHDGQSNYSEYVAGTQPDNPVSLLAIVSHNVNPATGSVSIVWASVPGRTYRLRFSPDLNDETWVDLSPDVAATSGTTTATAAVLPDLPLNRGYVKVCVVP